MPKRKDLTGQKFGRLTATRFSHTANMKANWECTCECGSTVVVPAYGLKRKSTQSCGCLHKEILLQNNTKHGLRYTPEYSSWCSMKSRCLGGTSGHYKQYYVARGITVCDRWIDSFENFYADMGPKPSPTHSLDRINNDGNYEPSNCRWADKATQSRNQRTQSNNKSGTRGVYWNNQCQKWAAAIRLNSRTLHLGMFSNLDDAIKARKDAEEQHWK
jgi:hypothetical protein